MGESWNGIWGSMESCGLLSLEGKVPTFMFPSLQQHCTRWELLRAPTSLINPKPVRGGQGDIPPASIL